MDGSELVRAMAQGAPVWCSAAKTLDLLRRQRELDAKGGSR